MESCSGHSRLCQLLEEHRTQPDGDHGKQTHSRAGVNAWKTATEQRLASIGEPMKARAGYINWKLGIRTIRHSWLCWQIEFQGERWSFFRRHLGFSP